MALGTGNDGAAPTAAQDASRPLKISVVTTVYNDVRVGRALESILCQQHDCALELIVIDGGSDDGTREVLERYRDRLNVLVSEPDRGMYDGMNKGLNAATGDIVGILNADDRYADANVLRDVAAVFRNSPAVQVCYGDLVYVNGKDEVSRYWKSGTNRRIKWRFGWRPPHPTFFVRRSVYQKYGLFDADYEIGGDYDMQLRLLFKHRLASRHIPRVLVRMAVGGASTGKVRGIVKAHLEATCAWRKNGLWGATVILVLKPVIKIAQRFRRPR